MRDFTIAQLDEQELKQQQGRVVAALLDARPEGGFTTAEHSVNATFKGYVSRNLAHHMRGSIGGGEPPPDAWPPEAWLTHEDEAVLRAVAVAVGYDTLVALASSDESGGNYLGAARYTWVAAYLGTQVPNRCNAPTIPPLMKSTPTHPFPTTTLLRGVWRWRTGTTYCTARLT